MDEAVYGEGSAWDSKTRGKSEVLCYLSSLVNKTYYIVLTGETNHKLSSSVLLHNHSQEVYKIELNRV